MNYYLRGHYIDEKLTSTVLLEVCKKQWRIGPQRLLPSSCCVDISNCFCCIRERADSVDWINCEVADGFYHIPVLTRSHSRSRLVKGESRGRLGERRKKWRGYHPYCIASLALLSLIFLVNTLRDESVVNTTCHLTEHWGGTEHHITAIPVPLVQGQKEKKRGTAKNCLLKQSNCRLTKTIHNHLLSRYNLELTWWNKVVSDTTRTRKGLWKCDRQNFILRYGRRKCLKNAFRRSGEDPNMVERTAWETHSAGLEKSPNVVIYH